MKRCTIEQMDEQMSVAELVNECFDLEWNRKRREEEIKREEIVVYARQDQNSSCKRMDEEITTQRDALAMCSSIDSSVTGTFN